MLSEKFGLYRIEMLQDPDGFFFCDIEYLEEDGTAFAYENSKPFVDGLEALKTGMVRLAELFWDDLEVTMETKTPSNEGAQLTGAGKGTRTPDILLGKKSVAVKSSEPEVQS